ncbi:hypothetical protein SAXI111661_20035 [Saccharomonospora xinjiangensis]
MRQRPVSLRMWPSAIARYTSGDSSRFTPPATARSHAPVRSAVTAWAIAVSELEQAVSTVTLGPRKSKKYDTRFATSDCADPVPACPSW